MKKKSIKEIYAQEWRISRNYPWCIRKNRCKLVHDIFNAMCKYALMRTEIGRFMIELEEARCMNQPSYINAAQELAFLARKGNEKAIQAINIK